MSWQRENGRHFSAKQKSAIRKLYRDGKTVTEIAEQVGAATSGISYIVGTVKKDKPEAPKTEEKSTSPNGKVQVLKATLSLQEENEFLRWWNQGERKGWVDRLLSEIQK